MLRSWLCTIIFSFLSHDPLPPYLTVSHHLTPILGTNVPVLLLFCFETPFRLILTIVRPFQLD